MTKKIICERWGNKLIEPKGNRDITNSGMKQREINFKMSTNATKSQPMGGCHSLSFTLQQIH